MSQDLRRTPTSTGNQKVFTYSCWIKRNGLSAWARLLSIMDGNTDAIIQLTNVDKLRFRDEVTGPDIDYISSRPLRDAGSWMHVLVAIDTTAIQAEHRIRMYINGDSLIEHGLDTESMPGDRNLDLQFNDSGLEHRFFARNNNSEYFLGEAFDLFWVDGQALTPDVFGFNKDGDGYVSVGSTQATDFRPGQWSPKAPRIIKSEINRRGGFGVNGFYLPMNDSSNFGADFHTTPNSIITLKGEDLPQPRNGAPTTSDAYVSQLRSDPYAANLVLAVPGIDTNTNPELVTNGDFSNGTTGWTGLSGGSLSVEDGKLKITETTGAVDAYAVNGTAITTVVGRTYTIKWTFTEGTNTSFTVRFGNSGNQSLEYQSNSATGGSFPSSGSYAYTFTATATQLNLSFIVNQASSYGYLSNVSVKEAVPVKDYSADIKGSGTNRTPTIQKCGVTSPVASYYGSAISMGGSGDFLYYDLDGSGVNAYGTGDFTFECWFFAIQEPENWGILMAHSTNGSWANGITLTSKRNTTRVFTIYTHDGSTTVETIGTTTWALNQWHHVVAERYNGQLTLYVNGVAEATRADTRNYAVAGTPASSAQYGLSIGNQSNASYTSNGYFQDVRVYRGVAKYKGGFDVSKPYTPVGFEGQSWRQVPDTCKNNFATWNPLSAFDGTLSNGNLQITSNDSFATMGVKSGKWYWEARIEDPNTSDGAVHHLGWTFTNYNEHATAGDAYSSPTGRLNIRSDGQDQCTQGDGSTIVLGTSTGSAPSLGTGDILGIELDLDSATKTCKFYKNGTLALTKEFSYTPLHFAMPLNRANGLTQQTNFGQNPTFCGNTTAGTYTDSNGKGLFKYQPSTGFLALCEDNLPAPAIADPGEHFKTVLYTGDGNSGRSITGVGFKPDLVWVKCRSHSKWHALVDSVRGNTKTLYSNSTSTEITETHVSSFDDNGFTVADIDSGTANEPNFQYVAWCWKAGGPAITNNDGSRTTQISVNQTAGFSIGTFTGDVANTHTIGHGLGKVPAMIIVKERTGNSGWAVYHKARGNTKVSYLNFSDDEYTETGDTSSWNATDPTSSVFSVGKNGATNDNTLVFYAWAEIEGFSKFGSYIGNGNADGPFVYCGFKPAWVMVKNVDDTGGRNWGIQDSSRKSTNPCDKHLKADTNEVENSGLAGSTYQIDLLSNGFKVRNNTGIWNNSGETIIFMAFAESPFQTANAK